MCRVKHSLLNSPQSLGFSLTGWTVTCLFVCPQLHQLCLKHFASAQTVSIG